jgi:hypothetical protein
MPIRNKDGNLFKLQGVNPLMSEQDRWDKETWIIHYVEPEKITVRGSKKISPETPEIETEPLPTTEPQQTEILYCLPLIVRVEEDPLYGQNKQIASWGDKFSFEAIRIEYTGLTAMFFTRLPPGAVSQLARGSIIYVFKERQWWKINGIEESGDGLKIYCVPSELKPSFV